MISIKSLLRFLLCCYLPLFMGCASLISTSTPDTNPYLADKPEVSAEVQQTFSRAVKAMEKKHWKDAKKILLPLWRKQPNLSGVALNLGLVYQNLNDLKLSELYYKSAISANENNLMAYNYLAVLQRQRGEFQQAESTYLKALSRWDSHDVSHYNLAILYELYMGKFDKALSHYQRYQSLQSEPKRKVKGWIKDLQRRVKAAAVNTEVVNIGDVKEEPS